MNRRILPVLLFAFFLFVLPVKAQLAMGKWRMHFAYNAVSQVAQSENKIFALSEGALFSVDKRDGNMEYYSKLSGLNGTTISCIEYDEKTETLVIVYANGNIDLMRSGGVENVPDLYNKQMSTSKAVNAINFYNHRAYLACDFGILVLNLEKNEVADTYIMGHDASEVKVLSITFYDGYIYAVTPDAVYRANINSPYLVNYEYWTQLTSLPGSDDFVQILAYNERLFLLRGSKLYVQNGASWTSYLPSLNFYGAKLIEDRMLGYGDGAMYLFNADDSYTTISAFGTIQDAEYESANQKYWCAAGNLGVASYTEASGSPEVNYYKPNGPASNMPYRLRFGGKKLFVVKGSRWGVQYSRPGDVMFYENGEWNNIVMADIEAVLGQPVYDFMDVAVDPADNSHFYVTSYGMGLLEFRNNTFYKQHTVGNSAVETAAPTNPAYYTRTDGGVFDDDGNLWFTNVGGSITYNIKVLKTDSTWVGLRYGDMMRVPTLGMLLISKINKKHKWILSCRATPGIVVFDDNGTLEESSDDKAIFLSSFYDQDYNLLTPTQYYSITQDQDGTIWVGTEIGPLTFPNPSNAFETGFGCTRVKISRNDGTGLADFLLDNVQVNDIAIDGANRKWIATNGSGVYLMSEDGEETVQHFTTSNSPLLSNTVTSLAINPVTGEVFIGTDAGLVSYQSDAAEGGNTFGNIYAYPNPVRESFDGLITITGLVDNTIVKITDVAGNLVCETTSNGSLAVWDGKNKSGKRVSTGVYLAICLTEDGQQQAITKILVIN